jgi:flagellar motor component MotA
MGSFALILPKRHDHRRFIMIFRFILGSILALAALFVGVLSSGGKISLITELYAVLPSLGVPIGAVLAAYGPKRTGKALGAIFSSDPGKVSLSALFEAKALLRFLVLIIAATSFLVFFLGMLWTLACLTVKADVGISFSRALSSILHGAFLIIWIIMPFTCALEAKTAALNAESRPRKESQEAMASKATTGSYPWIILSLAVIVCAYLIRFQSLFPFIYDLSSLSLVPLLLFAVSLIAMSPVDLACCFSLAFGKNGASAPKSELARARARAAFLTRATIALSIFGPLLGFLYMIAEFDNKNRVGPCMAVVTLSPLYGCLLLILVFLPLQAALERRLAASE